MIEQATPDFTSTQIMHFSPIPYFFPHFSTDDFYSLKYTEEIENLYLINEGRGLLFLEVRIWIKNAWILIFSKMFGDEQSEASKEMSQHQQQIQKSLILNSAQTKKIALLKKLQQ